MKHLSIVTLFVFTCFAIHAQTGKAGKRTPAKGTGKKTVTVRKTNSSVNDRVNRVDTASVRSRGTNAADSTRRVNRENNNVRFQRDGLNTNVNNRGVANGTNNNGSLPVNTRPGLTTTPTGGTPVIASGSGTTGTAVSGTGIAVSGNTTTGAGVSTTGSSVITSGSTPVTISTNGSAIVPTTGAGTTGIGSNRNSIDVGGTGVGASSAAPGAGTTATAPGSTLTASTVVITAGADNQANAAKVLNLPDAVSATFSTTNPTATNVSWNFKDDHWNALYPVGNNRVVSIYRPDGALVYTRTDLELTDNNLIPTAVINYKNQNKGVQILKVTRVEMPAAEERFEIRTTDGKTITIDKNGAPVK